ncbi:MAG: 2-hydroxyhepta-2,4-diene-1,7-dioate isomerase [Gammaproteobacteria bacterium RIFCSPHIGHO2_12_FULL_36_30]|nr:MAG: 2-hydroxyhepta-2,4-diene-1,7-dioate isomerase [Gammaproteobacteria bacterium RIFCSPHIGHO2_12_FULL_36_30]
MKIICIGRNYSEHVKELNSAMPDDLVFFLKPETALLLNNKPFHLPQFSCDIHHEIEIVLKIKKDGKKVDEKDADNFYDELTVGIDFTARDIQKILKEKSLPWEKAKAFDDSAVVGKFISKKTLPAMNNLNFHLNINNKTVQKGNTRDLLFSFDKIISHVSQYMTLKEDDLIYTGTPAGVGAVKSSDVLEGFLEDQKLLLCEILQ